MHLVLPVEELIAFESLTSLLERSRQKNHYTAKNWLQTLPKPIRGRQPNLLRSVTDFQHLAELLDLEVETLYELTLHRFVSCYYLPEAWPVWPLEHDDLPAPLWEISGLERYVHGQGHEKICPLCWDEQHAILLPWSLRHITMCPAHGIFLVDRCSGCDQLLNIDQESGACATCGLELAGLPITDLGAEKETLELTSLLWSAIGCSTSSFPPIGLPLAEQHPFWKMPPAAFLQFLWYGGQLVATRDPQHSLFNWHTDKRTHVQEVMETSLRQAEVQMVHPVQLAMWQVLKGWPHSWYTLLEQLVQQEEPLTSTPSTCFPALLKAQFPNDAFAWLHQGTEDFMWRSRGKFVQLSSWRHYWQSTEHEKQTKPSKKGLQRTLNLTQFSFPSERITSR